MYRIDSQMMCNFLSFLQLTLFRCYGLLHEHCAVGVHSRIFLMLALFHHHIATAMFVRIHIAGAIHLFY